MHQKGTLHLDAMHQKGTLHLDAMHQNGALHLDAMHQKGALHLDAMHQNGTLHLDAMHQNGTLHLDAMTIAPVITHVYFRVFQKNRSSRDSFARIVHLRNYLCVRMISLTIFP